MLDARMLLKNQRTLDSAEAENGVEICTVNKLVLDVNTDKLFQGEDDQRLPKMCKKCFLAYRTNGRQSTVIWSKLRQALELLQLLLVSTLSTMVGHSAASSRNHEYHFGFCVTPDYLHVEAEVGLCPTSVYIACFATALVYTNRSLSALLL